MELLKKHDKHFLGSIRWVFDQMNDQGGYPRLAASVRQA
jgi:hypothetical protein